jgi:hypothetical protein
MIKVICDRCGAELDDGGNDNELHFTKKRITRYGYDKLIHLCDICLKDFNKFINSEK